MGFNPHISLSARSSPHLLCALDKLVVSLCREEGFHPMAFLSPRGGAFATVIVCLIALNPVSLNTFCRIFLDLTSYSHLFA